MFLFDTFGNYFKTLFYFINSGVTGSAKKAKKSGDKSEEFEGTADEPIVSVNNDETENDIIQEENSFKNKEENIASS